VSHITLCWDYHTQWQTSYENVHKYTNYNAYVGYNKRVHYLDVLWGQLWSPTTKIWATHVARMGEERGVYRVSVGKLEGKRPLWRPRRIWVDNIRTDLQEVGCGYMDWIGLTQVRDRWRTLVSTVMNFQVPWNAGNFLTSFKPVSFIKKDSAPWSE